MSVLAGWLFLVALALPTEIPDPLAATASTDGDLFMRDLESQIRYLEELRERGGADISTHRDLAVARWQKGLIDSDIPAIGEALEIVRELALRAPDDPRDLVLQARLNMSLHRFAEARRDLARARDLGAPRRVVRSLLAEALLNLGHREEAERLLAAADDPATPDLVHQTTVARSALAARRTEQAVRTAEEAMANLRTSNPLPAVALYLLRAEIHQQQGESHAAGALAQLAARRLPRHVGAALALADHLLAKGEVEDAIKELERVRRTSPDPRLLIQLAAAYHLLGEIPRAQSLERRGRESLHRLLEEYPKVYAAHHANTHHTHHTVGDP